MQKEDYKKYLGTREDATEFIQWCFDNEIQPPSGEYQINGTVQLKESSKMIVFEVVPEKLADPKKFKDYKPPFKDFPKNARIQGLFNPDYVRFTENQVESTGKILPFIVSVIALAVVFGGIIGLMFLF